MPKVNREFNQAEYTKEYHRQHYKKLAVVCTKEEAAAVEAAAAAAGISKSQFIKTAVFEKIDRTK